MTSTTKTKKPPTDPTAGSRMTGENISGATLVFTTKILAPLMKSKVLTSRELINVASTSRAVLMAINVQDAQLLNLPLTISRPETMKALDNYFTYAAFSLATPTSRKPRRSIISRLSFSGGGGGGSSSSSNAAPSSPPSPSKMASTALVEGSGGEEREASSGMLRRSATAQPGQLAASPPSSKEIMTKNRLTAWRFSSATVIGDEALSQFLSTLANNSAPSSTPLKGSIQTLTVKNTTTSSPAGFLAKLSPLTRTLRTLHLIDCEGLFSGGEEKLPSLPILKELRVVGKGVRMKTNLSSGFNKLESLTLETGQGPNHDEGCLMGLTELKTLHLVYVDAAAAESTTTPNSLSRESPLIPRLPPSTKLRDLIVSGAEQADFATLAQKSRTLDALASSALFKTLEISDSRSLTELPSNMADFHAVRVLSLKRNARLQNLANLSFTRDLTSLDLSGCLALTDLGPLSSLSPTVFTKLVLGGCASVRKLHGIEGLVAIRELDLSSCVSLEDEGLGEVLARRLKNLETLDVSECPLVSSFEVGPSLRILKAQKCEGLASAPGCALAERLERVDFTGCVWLKDIEGLGDAKRLREVVLRGCGRLKSVSPLARASPTIEFLDISFATVDGLRDVFLNAKCAITDLYADAQSTSLESLSQCLPKMGSSNSNSNSNSNPSSEEFTTGENAVLKRLSFSACRSLRSVNALSGFREITEADLSGAGMKDCRALGNLRLLRRLNLSRCQNLAEVSGLDACESLLDVNLSECIALEDISPLGKCQRLRWIRASGCEELRRLSGLLDLSKRAVLKRIELNGCEKSIFTSDDAEMRAVCEMQLKYGTLVSYSSAAAAEWGGARFETIELDFRTTLEANNNNNNVKGEGRKGGGGCQIC